MFEYGSPSDSFPYFEVKTIGVVVVGGDIVDKKQKSIKTLNLNFSEISYGSLNLTHFSYNKGVFYN